MNNQNPNEQQKQENKLTQLAKNQAKNQVAKQIKKYGMLAVKKASAFIFSKFGVILLIILGVVLIVGLLVILVTPDMTLAKNKTKEELRVLTSENLQRYATLTYKYNIQDVRYGLMLSMGKFENEHMLEYSPDESSFMLFDMEYDEYIPPLQSCSVEQAVTNEDGTPVTNEDGTPVTEMVEVVSPMIEGVPLADNCTKISDKVTLRYEYLTTKDAILDFMDEKKALTIEGDYPKRKFIVDDAKLYIPFNQVPFVVVDIFYHGTPIEEAMDEWDLNKSEREHIEMVREISEAIDLLFEEYGISLNGNHIGNGAYCVQDGVVDENVISSVLDSSGVFAGHTQTFIDTANEYNIDVVLMVSIALHETGNGSSNAVVNKNNPGGLMNPATGSKELFEYATLEDGIKAMGKTLNNRINKDGLITIESLGSVYAPIGAANDPNNLNAHWTGNVGKNVAKLGGLTMNCSSYNAINITFNGDVSEARQKVASVGTKWIGNSVYVFGGGRNQSDIAIGNFDCSSFVHWAFAQAGVNLGNVTSTSTETLNKMGSKIPISEMQVGDLIFWDTYKKDGHVGIYIGNGQFIGSQSSTGVSIESIDNSYWKSHFSGHVRRILD